MPSQGLSDIARQTRSALVGIRSIPGLTKGDDAEVSRLVAEADRLNSICDNQRDTPASDKSWITGLRSLAAAGEEIERKYKQ